MSLSVCQDRRADVQIAPNKGWPMTSTLNTCTRLLWFSIPSSSRLIHTTQQFSLLLISRFKKKFCSPYLSGTDWIVLPLNRYNFSFVHDLKKKKVVLAISTGRRLICSSDLSARTLTTLSAESRSYVIRWCMDDSRIKLISCLPHIIISWRKMRGEIYFPTSSPINYASLQRFWKGFTFETHLTILIPIGKNNLGDILTLYAL